MPRPRRAPAGDPKRAIGYARASTTDQKLTHEAQRVAIERWCKHEGIELVQHIAEHASGAAKLETRQILDAIAACRTHRAGLLVVVQRDRVARDVLTSIMLERLTEQAGAKILSLAGEGTGDGDPVTERAFRRMIDTFSEMERGMISKRTRAANQRLREMGLVFAGKPPYGYRNRKGKCEREPREWKILQQVLRWRRHGWAYQKIADELTRRKIFNRNRNPFALTQIVRMIKRNTPPEKAPTDKAA